MVLQVAFDFLCINTVSQASTLPMGDSDPRERGLLVFFLNTKILKYLIHLIKQVGNSKPVSEFYYSQGYPPPASPPPLIRYNK